MSLAWLIIITIATLQSSSIIRNTMPKLDIPFSLKRLKKIMFTSRLFIKLITTVSMEMLILLSAATKRFYTKRITIDTMTTIHLTSTTASQFTLQ